MITQLEPRESSQQTSSDILTLHVYKLEGRTHTRSTQEGREFPGRAHGFPSLGSEVLRIVAPETFVALHTAKVCLDNGTFLDEERLIAINTSSGGEDAGLEAFALARLRDGDETVCCARSI